MGLMYIFPVTDNVDEDDRARVIDSTLVLKTYGLPMIFWGYLVAVISVVAVMWLASRAVVLKLISYSEDPTLVYLGYLVQYTLILAPIVMLAFFFYEKVISKKGLDLTVSHRVFFITFWKTKYKLNSNDSLVVNHFMDSPNMAKLRNQHGLGDASAMKHFENKGYFELTIKTDKRSISIDRHSRKADLIKLKDLLSKY